MEPCRLTATEASQAMREGRLTSEDLMISCLERIQARDHQVKAFLSLDPDRAIRLARAADKQAAKSPLHGIPIVVKDIIDTFDLPTSHNSPIFPGHQPGQDAACVRAVRALGAIILGKVDTHEFACGGWMPATRNPHDLRCTPGGSSAGSGAAVADYMSPLAFGTQTGGSTIRPAAFCGIFSMKPTFNEVSREGFKQFSVSLDTLGWFARSVADLALVARSLGVGRKEWQPLDSIRGLKIALCRTPMWDLAEPESQEATEKAARLLAQSGAVVEDLELGQPFDQMNEFQDIVMHGEGRAAFHDLNLAYPHLLHDDFKADAENRRGITTVQLAEALDILAASRPVFDRMASGYDAVLTPAAPGEAPQSLESTGLATFSRIWTALHIPCLAMPFTQGPRGLPVGVQLVGPRYSDIHLLGVAEAVSKILMKDNRAGTKWS